MSAAHTHTPACDGECFAETAAALELERSARAREFRTLRLAGSFTQAALAEALDIHARTVSDYETGRRPIPTVVFYAAEHLMLCPRRA